MSQSITMSMEKAVKGDPQAVDTNHQEGYGPHEGVYEFFSFEWLHWLQ